MPITGRSSLPNPRIASDTQALLTLNEELNKAVKRRGVVVNMLRAAPASVTDQMLVRARSCLEEALHKLAPHVESQKVSKDQVDEYYDALSALYEETIQRQLTTEPIASSDTTSDLGALKKQTEKLLGYFKTAKNQIFAIEQAIKFSTSSDFKAELKLRLANAVTRYFLRAAQQYFEADGILGNFLKEGNDSLEEVFAGLKTGETNEKLSDLQKVTDTFKSSISLSMNEVGKASHEANPDQFEYRMLGAYLNDWVKKVREHALTSSHVIFKTMETQSEMPTNDNQRLSMLLGDYFEITLNVVDACDKMMSSEFNTRKEYKTFIDKGTAASTSKNTSVAKPSYLEQLLSNMGVIGHSQTDHSASQTPATPTHPEVHADSYKRYPFPKAEHWLSLFEQNEIADIGTPKVLPSAKEYLYEIEIVPKPTGDGKPADPVYLHLHLSSKPVLKKNQTLIQALIEHPDLISAAHLKSSYHRNKGKTWETDQVLLGKYESLVKRSPVSPKFLSAIESFCKQRGR